MNGRRTQYGGRIRCCGSIECVFMGDLKGFQDSGGGVM